MAFVPRQALPQHRLLLVRLPSVEISGLEARFLVRSPQIYGALDAVLENFSQIFEVFLFRSAIKVDFWYFEKIF